MKHLYSIITCLFVFGASQAQELPLDFSDPLDEFSDAGSTFDIIQDPNDASNDVGQIQGGAGQYDNVQLDLVTYIDLTTSNTTITFDFYVDPNSGISSMPGLFQLASSIDGSPAVEVGFTATPGWNTYSLDFANATYAYPFCSGCPQDAGALVLAEYGKIVFFTDFAVTTTGTYLLDDVAGAANGGPVGGAAEPQTAAPAPTDPASEVLSMFSNTYNNVTVDTWNTSWSQASLEDIQIGGNDIKKYTSLNFNGIETIAPNSLDLTNYGFMHMDVWTPNSTALRIKLVDFLGDGFTGGGADPEAEVTITPVQNQWQSVVIPMTDFTNNGLTAVSDISQLIISSDPAGTSIVYIDNVYFSENQPLSTARQELVDLITYPNPVGEVWNLSLDHDIEQVTIFSVLGNTVKHIEPKAGNVSIQMGDLSNGIYFAKIASAQGVSTVKLIKK